MKKIVVNIMLMALFCLQSAPLFDVPTQIAQPDGQELNLFMSGDEHFNYLHDKDGYTIIKNQQTEYYTYAKEEGGKLVSTNLIVGRDLPQNLKKKQLISQEEYSTKVNSFHANKPKKRLVQPFKSGNLNSVIVFIYFKDQTPFTQSEVDQYLARFNTNEASIKGYFKENSYGKLNVQGQGNVNIQYQDNKNYSDYQSETSSSPAQQQVCYNAIKWLSSNNKFPANMEVDGNSDGEVDNIFFIVKGSYGKWGSFFWPVQWWFDYNHADATILGKKAQTFIFVPQSLQNETTALSMYCHELTHACGAPDLYRYPYKGEAPVGGWDNLGDNLHSKPIHNLAYIKYKYTGWIDDIPFVSDGVHNLTSLFANKSGSAVRFRSPVGKKEYFVAEYRKSESYDENIYGEGLIIYRIDEDAADKKGHTGNAYGPPDEVYIFRPGDVNKFDPTALYTSHLTSSTYSEASFTSNIKLALKNSTDPLLKISNVTTPSNSISFTLTGTASLSVPSNLTYTLNNSELTLKWNSPAQTPLSYSVYKDHEIVMTTTNYDYKENLVAGGKHTYYVTANYSSGESNISNLVNVDLPTQSLWTYSSAGINQADLYISDFSIVDENNLWAIISSYDYFLYKLRITISSDGGISWTAKDIEGFEGYRISCLSAISQTKAWATLYSTVLGSKIIMTNDGGNSWTTQATYSQPTFLNVIKMFDESKGYASGDPNSDGYFKIFTTSDGGLTWTRVAKTNIKNATGGNFTTGTGEEGVVGVIESIGNSSWFGTKLGYVYKTTDNGKNWNAVKTPASTGKNFLDKLTFNDDKNGMAVFYESSTKNYYYGYTTDGGATWKNITPSRTPYRFITAIPGGLNKGKFITLSDRPNDPGILLTEDFGLNWKKISTSGVPFTSVKFYSASKGWSGSIAQNNTGIAIWNRGDIWSGSSDISTEPISSTFYLAQNYPNPFNPTTTISFTLKNQERVNLSVFNAKGELVKQLINSDIKAGLHQVDFDGSNLNSGIYFYRLKTANHNSVNKMVLIK